MIDIQPLGQATPVVCQNYTGARIKFHSEGLSLTVPNAVEEKIIRWLIDQGKSLSQAYREAGSVWIIPDEGIRPCISEVLRTKWYNQQTGTWETAGIGQWTCTKFFNCFEEYIKAQRDWPEASLQDRRMEIAPGVYTPSAAEDACIRKDFFLNRDIVAAFERCNASAILPRWPGALTFIASALSNCPTCHLYQIMKDSYRLQAIQPPAKPSITPPTSPVAAEKSKLFPIAAAGLAVLAIYVSIK